MIILGECMTVHSGSRKYLNTYRRKLLRIIMYVCVSVKHFEIETRYRRDHIDKISNESENLCTRYLSQICI